VRRGEGRALAARSPLPSNDRRIGAETVAATRQANDLVANSLGLLRLAAAVVVVEPVSLLLLHDDVCVCVVVVVNGVPCPLSFGLVAVVIDEHVLTLSATPGAAGMSTAAATKAP
jgi:hypothetical protein